MGWQAEWCGEFIDADHETMHQLIKRFGLRTIDLGGGRTDRIRSVLYFCNRYYREEELAEDFLAFAPRLQQQVQEAGFPTTYAHFTQERVRLDHLSVYDMPATACSNCSMSSPASALITPARRR